MEPRSRGVVPLVRTIAAFAGPRLAALLGARLLAAARGDRDRHPARRELAPGMKGYALSDLGDGKGVQRFDVEIVGVLKSYAPKQDLILARVLTTTRSRRPASSRA